MAESTLSVTRTDIRRQVGDLLGFRRDDNQWSQSERDRVNNIVRRGLRRFYMPHPIEGERKAHTWSFMFLEETVSVWPSASVDADVTVDGTAGTITTSTYTFYPTHVGKTIVITGQGSYEITEYTSGTQVTVDASGLNFTGATFSITANGNYNLPDDFGYTDGSMTFDSVTGFPPVVKMHPEQIRQRRQSAYNLTTGRPCRYAVKPRNKPGTTGQRFHLMLWPTPDSVYTLHYDYFFLSDALDETNEHLPGGMLHGETIVQSCMAIAEEMMIPGETRQRGAYAAMLSASINQDRLAHQADNLGYNGDRSDPVDIRNRHGFQPVYTSIEGVIT